MLITQKSPSQAMTNDELRRLDGWSVTTRSIFHPSKTIPGKKPPLDVWNQLSAMRPGRYDLIPTPHEMTHDNTPIGWFIDDLRVNDGLLRVKKVVINVLHPNELIKNQDGSFLNPHFVMSCYYKTQKSPDDLSDLEIQLKRQEVEKLHNNQVLEAQQYTWRSAYGLLGIIPFVKFIFP